VRPGKKHPSGAQDHFHHCQTVTGPQTRGRVRYPHPLPALASSVNLGSESRGIRDHIPPSQIREFPLHWLSRNGSCPHYIASTRTPQKTPLPTLTLLLHVTQPLPNNVCFSGSTILALSKHATIYWATVILNPHLHEFASLNTPATRCGHSGN
jgi:hypothetical protein